MTITELIKRHEGLRLMPYEDTVGLITIGYGRCLTRDGISQAEADAMLDSDIAVVTRALSFRPWWNDLDDVRKAVVTDIAFNVGLEGFNRFVKMLAALANADYGAAADEILNSHIAPGRRAENAALMRQGAES